MTNKEWFKKEARFGLMIHWGLYSLLAGEYRGQRMGDMIGEWAQSYFRIPNKDMKDSKFRILYWFRDHTEVLRYKLHRVFQRSI